ncbi:MAG TPA: HipA domain-containing protein [Usitatibacter sp.]|nr:HipA domain-containing protein [Usitatibacter sp.]
MPEERKLWVHIELHGRTHPIGVLHAHLDDDFERADLELAPAWRERPDASLYAPLLGVPRGAQRTGASMPLFGALGDSAPDRWGRTLLRRFERWQAGREGRPARVLREADFLLGVHDEMRAGALRFSQRENGPFDRHGAPDRLPRHADLGRLLRAVRAHEEGRETESQRRLLIACGQLLGGSRPKASLRLADGRLVLAKFPSLGDTRDMQRWEALALALAGDCGLEVPAFSLERAGRESVLLLDRFDRTPAGQRIPFITAYGWLEAQDNEAGSYVAMARALRAIGGRPHDDIVALWRRALLTILVSDKDNHLRNHGLVLRETGWRLCPAYDINPEPEPREPRLLLLSVDGVDDTASLDIVLAAAGEFGLDAREARDEAKRIAQGVATWRERAAALGLPRKEIDAMEDAFEHRSLHAALRLPGARLAPGDPTAGATRVTSRPRGPSRRGARSSARRSRKR